MRPKSCFFQVMQMSKTKLGAGSGRTILYITGVAGRKPPFHERAWREAGTVAAADAGPGHVKGSAGTGPPGERFLTGSQVQHRLLLGLHLTHGSALPEVDRAVAEDATFSRHHTWIRQHR